jgi:hypothetical protein
VPGPTKTARDAVALALTQGTFSQTLTVTAAWTDEGDRDRLGDTAEAMVLPGPREVLNQNRDGSLDVGQRVLVIVRRVMPSTGREAAIEAMLELGDEIERELAEKVVGFRAFSATEREVYDEELLREAGVFLTTFDVSVHQSNE